MACLLFEDSFYEDGQSIAERIKDLSGQVSAETLSAFAIEAREQMHLRHVPLLLTSLLAYRHRENAVVRQTVARVVQRADELAELVAIHASVNGVDTSKAKKVLGAQMKRGLAEAFTKFDAYHLAKYNRDGAVKLRDVLFLSHAKPKDAEQEAAWKRLVDGTLAAPDTWEVGLSSGGDKRETFERLLREGKLGYLALLRNLRNMIQAGVDDGLIRAAIVERKGARRVLPFRYVAAARHAPQYEREIDQALLAAVGEQHKLPGKTVVLVDVSDSMNSRISAKSDMKRIDAAAALGAIVSAQTLRVFTFSNYLVEVPPRVGMAGVDTIIRNQPHRWTDLGGAVKAVNDRFEYDRLIVVTDEQSHTRVPDPKGRGYMVNVASNRNGVGYGKWVHIDGWSEAVLRYIAEYESASV